MTVVRVAGIVELYARWGHDNYDEEVSQLAHALQTAAFAVAAGAPDPLIAAALLHDVGHLLQLEAGNAGVDADLRHEVGGSTYLAGWFPPAVTGPVALHVQAKRYLCAVDAGYLSALSPGSIRSLARQGGPMSPTDVVAFESEPGHVDAVRLRRWDDAGKVDGLEVAPFDHYRALLDGLAGRPVSP